MWHLGAWFSSGLGSVRFMAGFGDKGLFQPKWLSFCVVSLSWPGGSEILHLKIMRRPSGFPLRSHGIRFFFLPSSASHPSALTNNPGRPGFFYFSCYSSQPRHILSAHVPKPIVFAVSSMLVVDLIFSLLNASLAFGTEGLLYGVHLLVQSR